MEQERLESIIQFAVGKNATRLKNLSNNIYNNCDRDLRLGILDLEDVVKQQFGDETFNNIISHKNVISSLGVLLNYLVQTQKTGLERINNIEIYSDEQFMTIDYNTRRNLELTQNLVTKEKKHSLLWVLDRTKTAMGKRLLRSYIEQPLVSPAGIIRRQNAVSFLIDHLEIRDEIANYLTGVHDMERLITRISYGTANARELRSLYETVSLLSPIKDLIAGETTELLSSIEQNIDPLNDVLDLIDAAISEDPPFSVREGEMIKPGYNEELDSLREIVNGGKGYLAKIEADEQERTGIKKLKIGYNRVFGYYIEVSNSFKDQVPEEYIRKQTLANCERYITQELKELESKVLGAQERITRLEYELFSSVRDTVAAQLDRVQRTANAVSELDVLCSFAKVSNDLCKKFLLFYCNFSKFWI